MSGYIGPVPVPQGIQRKQSFTATAGQTTFNTNGYTDGNFITVYLNGVRLINGTDYTATNGSDVVLASAAAASDVLDFETFQTFSLVDQTFDNVTLKNPTHEDTDGGRESAVSFKGEQSGGEISTLAAIQASHDGTADDQKGDLIFKTNDGSDNNAPTEAMRIDSSRNVLIGTATANPTSSSVNTAGQEFSATGGVRSTVASNAPATFNRKTDDGAVILIRKDGTTAGIIGSASGSLYIGNDDAGILFNDHGGGDLDSILPYDVGSEALYNGHVDIGGASNKFRNIHISGSLTTGDGITFGDASGANVSSETLDGYEEGTWTPAVANGSLTSAQGTYTKIGNLVTLSLYISDITDTTSSDVFDISGVPFTPVASGTMDSNAGALMFRYCDVGVTEEIGNNSYISGGSSVMRFYVHQAAGTYTAVRHSHFNNGGIGLRAAITYRV